MTTISDERLADANEERQVFVDRDWWRAAGDIIGLELTGWTFRNEAQFVDRETRQSVVLTGAVATRLQSLRAQGGVRVKPLEWSSEPPYSVARVAALRLIYSIEAVWDDAVFQHVELRGGFASGDFATVEAAKAAAQADHERRILSSLEASPAAQGQTYPAAWMVRENERDTWDFVRMKKAADDLRERGFEVIALYLEASPAPVSEEMSKPTVEQAIESLVAALDEMRSQQAKRDEFLATLIVNIEKNEPTAEFAVNLREYVRNGRAALAAKGGQ